MRQALMLGAAAMVLAACSGDNEATATDEVNAASTTAKTAGSEAVTEAETEAEIVEASFAGDCMAEDGQAPVIDAVDRDQWGEFGIDLQAMDTRFEAGDDFFCFVNGAWYANFDMPSDKTRYGSFTLLRDKSEARVRGIIEELAAEQPDASTLEGKIAAVYNAYTDVEAIEAAGLTPLQPYFERIEAIESREDLARVFASVGYSSPIGGGVSIDAKKTDENIFYISQSGLGLGDRSFYLSDDGKNPEIREGYVAFLTKMLEEAGYDDPAEAAARVMALETEIATAHWDRTVNRNRNLTYNKLTRDELIALGGDFPVATMIDEFGLADQEAFVVSQVMPDEEEIQDLGLSKDNLEKISGGGIAAIMEVMNTADLEDWKAYLKARFVASNAAVLPERIDEASFEFFSKQLRGQQEQRPRWKRGVSAVEGALGEGVGKVYAARYFPAENKAEMDQLVTNLQLAMADNINEIDWMGEATKDEAREKLAKFTPKIGFTEKFETYDTLTVGDSAFENAMAARQWGFEDNLAKLGQPIDKTEWFMLPQTVNAYYSSTRNEIVFPAAILQPPFFNIDADPAINYGAIGGVIGHEFGHGFDDQGSKSDGDGVLRNWWTDEDRANFEARTDALVGQYNAFCPLDEGDTCVNGRLGLGENTGDLGGLSMAYKAYRMSLDVDGDGVVSDAEEAPVLDGFTGDQRFFMAWAQQWRNQYREDALRQQLIRGPHSPPYYRVNGIVRNFDEWYEAFDVGPDHALYLPPEDRIRIW
ncbi:MAG: M13 family metallopeptidase [Pseudomonadota bacterium]